MRCLILIKHSQVAVDPNGPAKDWHLSAEGRRRCKALAGQLARYGLAHIVASTEPKASETAQMVAAELHLPWHTAHDLHEHDRSNEPFGSPEQFQQRVAKFFAHPNELIFGKETANEALIRFAAAVDQIITAQPTGNIAIISHGTVIALFVAAHNQINPLELWQRLAMPSFVVLDALQFTLLDLVPIISCD